MPAKKKTSKKSAGSASKGRAKKASAKGSASKSVAGRAGASEKAASKAPSPPAQVQSGPPLVPGLLLVNMTPKSRSGEVEQDSEPFLAVNPLNTQQLVGSAFTPDPNGGPNAPVYLSTDGGQTWALKSIVPSNSMTGDITVAYSGTATSLYSGILKRPGNLLLNILRTTDPTTNNLMSVLSSRSNIDQPFVQAVTVSNKQRVYVGDNDFSATGGKTATVDLSLDAGVAAPAFSSARIETRSTGSAGQNGPQIRPVCHKDGTVYAAFYGWRAFSATSQVTADVVVVRDDHGGSTAPRFSSLIDANDGLAGMRVVKGVKFVWNDLLGNQRLGGNISIAVDPNNSRIVYLSWADVQPTTGYTLHVRRSTDGGKTWTPNDLRTVASATNPALAINSNGKVAFLYQKVIGSGASQHWVTQVDRAADGLNFTSSLVLANVPSNDPPVQFQPYIGDYLHMLALGKDFYGIFSTNNSPNPSNFPSGVKYLRNADFTLHRLLANNGTSVVHSSIDPFFFKLTE
jgi:hypothetical protein